MKRVVTLVFILGISEDESDVQETEQQDTAGILTTIASGVGNNSHSDFFFGDGDVEQCGFDYDSIGNLQNGPVRECFYLIWQIYPIVC